MKSFPCSRTPRHSLSGGGWSTAVLFSLLMLLSAGAAGAQSLILENDFRNRVRQPDTSAAPVNPDVPPPPPGSIQAGNAGKPGLRMSVSTHGGWQTRRTLRNGAVTAGAAVDTDGAVLTAAQFIFPTNGTLQMRSARLGRALVGRLASFGIGDVIPAPVTKADGMPAPDGYYLAEPVHVSAQATPEYDPVTGDLLAAATDPAGGDQAYWSPHARKVFAAQPGNISITWRVANTNPVELVTRTYVVSFSSSVPVRKIYWTENGYNGPRVTIPAARINEVKIVYNTYFPKTVAMTEIYPAPRGQTLVSKADRVRTLWMSQSGQQDGTLQAYNREGRVFVEFLGALSNDPATPGRRLHLGFEVVDVIRETPPLPKPLWVGERATPVDEPELDETALQPTLTTGITLGEPFFHRQITQDGANIDLYAVRTTTPTIVEGVEVPSNEAVAYWLENGSFGIRWPRQYTSYLVTWPDVLTDLEQYSLFARPSTGSAADDKATGIRLPGDNLPALVFQDDPDGAHAVLQPDRLFYTTGGGRALIRHQQGEFIWFERVLSGTDKEFNAATAVLTPAEEAGLNAAQKAALLAQKRKFAAWTQTVSASVGERLRHPLDDSSFPEALRPYRNAPGHIRPESGRAYAAAAYIDPLTAGFAEAERGAVIGVNALTAAGAPDTGKNTLEVWWFRQNAPPQGSGIKPSHWPSHVFRYTLAWPSDAAEIVMASNLGSGDLPSLQAKGAIYRQNDSALPGYNPDEEHAMTISGRVWALRDDLNLPLSSQPYALLSYTEADSRPAMRVFRVLREKAPWFFDYPATAGTVLQSPMPLPLLPLPYKNNAVAHTEVESEPDAPANVRETANLPYAEFTMKDRKGTTWIHRGPHDTGDPSFAMRFYYQLQPGFWFPALTANAQPAAGTVVPYLRPYTDTANPAAGFSGDAITGLPLNVVFRPVWPSSVPQLSLGQTLTLPTAGLPAVRGQTSTEIFYQQSIANQTVAAGTGAYPQRKSAVLYDPTRSKIHPLSSEGLAAVPGSIKVSNYLGKVFFPNLPPHLSQRFYVDPNIGTGGALVFKGEFKDEPVGEKYLLPNVLSTGEVTLLKALCADTDLNYGKWTAAIDSLSTDRETFIEDPAKRGTYIVGATDAFGGMQPVEITDDDQAVDSYALSAAGGGTGYVVLLTGNGLAFTPAGEPVAMHILKVTAPLYRGELKGIAPANPLDEKFTLQHTGDFAGSPQDYEFDWSYAPPVDGLPPPVYTRSRTLILGDGTWTLINQPPASAAALRGPDADISALNPVTVAAGDTFSVRSGAETASVPGGPPLAVMRRQFTFSLPAGSALSKLYLSLSTDIHTGVTAYLNSAPVAVRKVPGKTDTPAAGSPGGGFDPLPLVFSLPVNALQTGAAGGAAVTNVLTLELYTDADSGADAQVNARLEAELIEDVTNSWITLGVSPGESLNPDSNGVPGKNRHTVSGPGLLTLTDNYFIVRYRAKNTDHAAYTANAGWSSWTEPQLVEGWIKRALAGINPFQQRVTDLYNNAVNTNVSLVSQAGKRWEGDIALNLQNINSFGLIEIYETILRRGKMLSIDGTPPLSDPGANDALLLAAGYLNDLYLIMGNEAFADAADSTVAFGTNEGTYGAAVTSLFAFRGQVASVLEEELALLRGRDDFLQPGTRTAPFYNRLPWNYTRGIDAGEAIYALNYNIKDLSLNGIVGPEDAAQAYPQGHGDAWGHYLTALTGYYGLLRNERFSWTPRSEAVTVLGKAVSVDYQDERKFAGAAAALARTASQTLSLTYRQAFAAGETPTWTNLQNSRTNPSTGITRKWGVDDWASRGGQGAYLHWITANSMLPETDPDPAHEGIQKIDRTTVPELVEIASQAQAIQNSLDTADARLNPLGLSHSALPFDVDPNFLDVGSTIQGKMYFPQLFDRALAALQRAREAFSRAGTSTEFLRRQDDSLDERRAAISEQEMAFTAGLVDIYGTPYADDIGPGRTYIQDYAGPDFFHYAYVDQVEHLTSAPDEKVVEISYRAGATFTDASASLDFKPVLADPEEMLTVTINPRGEMVKPEAWTGRRAHPGRMQTTYSDWITARRELIEAAEDAQYTDLVTDRQLALFTSAVDAAEEQLSLEQDAVLSFGIQAPLKLALESAARYLKLADELSADTVGAVADGLPKSVGLAVDPSFPARLAARLGDAIASVSLNAAINGLTTAADVLGYTIELADRVTALEQSRSQWAHENRVLLHDLRQALEDTIVQRRALDGALRRFSQAERDLLTLQSEGLRIQREREVFRQRTAAIIHGYRTKDFAFRAFRNEALESYRILFDTAARASFLAARAYDYETGLLDASRSSFAAQFFNGIVQSRALGIISDSGTPETGGSAGGDPGLAGLLAKLNADWKVVESRLGFNNFDRYRTTFSLRSENFRLLSGAEGDGAWKETLETARMDNILEDADVRRYCLQAGPADGIPLPGFVIPFSTTIMPGQNFFGLPLAGGDHQFSPSSFATKIRASGIAFQGYIGMEDPGAAADATEDAGGDSPPDPWTGFLDPNALSATPYVYLVPVGVDSMRAPALGDSGAIRTWTVEDQALPLPFNIGGVASNTQPAWLTALSLTESPFILRKHQAFRAIPDGTAFSDDPGFTNGRLIGRSVWNSRWKLIIPGNTLLNDARKGARIFAETVKDIKLHLETYSYSGN